METVTTPTQETSYVIPVVIPEAPKKDNASTEPAATVSVETVTVETSSEFFVKFSGHLRPFEVPKYAEVALAGMFHFQQAGMMCHPIRLGSETIYKFVLQTEVEKMGHLLPFRVGNETHQIPLYTWERKTGGDGKGEDDEEGEKDGRNPLRRNQREEGILLTFFRAAQGPLGELDSNVFDDKIRAAGLELIVPTKFQRVPGMRDMTVLNGNRFCVIRRPEEEKAIPGTLVVNNGVADLFVRVNFRGQKRFCNRCRADHVGQCPSLKEFYEAREKRRQMSEEVKTKIFSDSTLRSADTLGLRAEICTMSGGGLGQVIQASLDDPATPSFENIVLVGGSNDMKEQNFTSNQLFAENIDRSLEKLKVAAREVPEKNFFVVKQVREQEDGAPKGRDALVRELYILRRLKQCAKDVQNISAVTVKYDTDPTAHPSEAGTVQILNQLSEKFSVPLVWNPAYLLSEKVYTGVQSIFRYGCNICSKYGMELNRTRFANQLVCDDCFESLNGNGNDLLQKICTKVDDSLQTEYNSSYPQHPKRRRESAGGEEVEQSPPSAPMEESPMEQ